MRYFLLFILSTTTLVAKEIKPYRVFIKEGVVLTKISDKSEVKLTKGIYANVLETSPTRREHFIVYDKSGKAVYQVDATSINEIANETRLLPDIDANIIYPAPFLHHSNDQFALFDTNFNLHLDNFQTRVFRKIYDTSSNSTIGPRYEFRTLYNSNLPVNFGISLNFQTFSFKDNENENITFSILSFGPQIERVVHKEESLSVSVVGGGEFAPVYRATTGEYTEKYSAMLFNLGVEGTWETRFGKLSLGTHFRYHDLTATETNRQNINLLPESITTSSIGVMAGYKHEWDL